jgi:hypothetical protein
MFTSTVSILDGKTFGNFFYGSEKMKTLTRLLCVGLGILLLPAIVQACVVSITISGDDGTFQEFTKDVDLVAGVTTRFDFVTSEQSLLGGSSVLESLALIINGDPEVGIVFGLRAGSSATTYSILSDVVVFDQIVNPQAYASAGVTLTDRPTAEGASIAGKFDGGKTHQARYNGTSVFANLVSGFSITSGTLTNNENKGTPAFPEMILDTVSSIESEFWFTLSARDSASGTSTFVVIPEPATVCLMGFAALAFLRKQK